MSSFRLPSLCASLQSFSVHLSCERVKPIKIQLCIIISSPSCDLSSSSLVPVVKNIQTSKQVHAQQFFRRYCCWLNERCHVMQTILPLQFALLLPVKRSLPKVCTPCANGNLFPLLKVCRTCYVLNDQAQTTPEERRHFVLAGPLLKFY